MKEILIDNDDARWLRVRCLEAKKAFDKWKSANNVLDGEIAMHQMLCNGQEDPNIPSFMLNEKERVKSIQRLQRERDGHAKDERAALLAIRNFILERTQDIEKTDELKA